MSKDPTCHVRDNPAQILALAKEILDARDKGETQELQFCAQMLANLCVHGMAFSEERRENLPLRQFVDTAQSIAREHIREGKLQIELDKLRQSNPNGWGNGK